MKSIIKTNLNRFLWLLLLPALCVPLLINRPAEAREATTVIKVPEVYIVREGDNLWHLSQKWYKDPYKWRSLWEKNMFVADPNLIYPGDPLLIPGSFMDREVVEIFQDEPVAEEKKVLPPATTVPAPPPGSVLLVPESVYYKSGFIETKTVWSGKIISGPPERTIFGQGDELFVDISGSDVSVGDQFSVVHIIRKVEHPITGEEVGNLIQEVGWLEVTENRGDNSSVLITRSFSNLEIGDRLMPIEKIEKIERDLLTKRVRKSMEGYIIAGKEMRDTFGQGSIVYLDVGRKENVTPGDRFIAYQGGKTIGKKGWFGGGKVINLPVTILGEIEVFNIRENTSTGVVKNSGKEVSLGARIRFKNSSSPLFVVP